MTLNTAFLPGVGHIKNPTAKHYRAAINHLRIEIRRAPLLPKNPNQGGPPTDPRVVLAERLWDTLHRIEWARREAEPERLAALREGRG